MARESKFNFIAYSNILTGDSQNRSVASFNPKLGILAFSLKNPDIEEYRNSLVKLYVDEKKNTIAWKFIQKNETINAQNDSLEYFMIKEVKVGKATQIRLYVPKKITKLLNFKPGASYRNIPIGKYQDSMILGIPPYHFVTISDSNIATKQES